MINSKKNLILFLLFYFFFSIIGFSKDCNAGSFLNIGVGARANGMGNAYTSLSEDATAIYWNPAGLCYISNTQLIGMYSAMSMDRHHNFAAFAYPINKTICIGIGWVNYGVSDIDGRDIMGYPTGNFSDSENALYLSLSKLFGRFSLGSSGKYIHHSLAANFANGFAFDIGCKFRINDFISVGATSRNIAGNLYWNTHSKTKETIPHSERIGLNMTPNILPITIASDLSLNSEKNPLHFGIEYQFLNKLSARAGYDSGNFTFGGSLQFASGFMNIQLDYSLSQDVLEEGATNRISILLDF